MRELKEDKDLQEAKDILCGFEEQYYSNPQTCSDIQSGLFWDEDAQVYSADLGQLLRGEVDEVRIYEVGMDGFIDAVVRPIAAYVSHSNRIYLFCVR